MLINPEEVQKVQNMFMNAIHEDEIELVNELYEKLKNGKEEEIDKLMEEFINDVEEHFSTEEELMKESDFFGYPMHKADHDRMREKVKKVYENWKKNKNREEVKKFLEEEFVPWIKLHIAQWDSTTAMHIGD